MSEQAAKLAEKLEAVNGEFIDVVGDCSAEQWQQTSANEGWTVGVVAHHAAGSHAAFNGLLQALASGNSQIPTVTMDMINTGNAQHAKDFASVGKPETLELLTRDGATLAQSINGLTDEQLSYTTNVFGGHEMTVAQIVENVVIGHPAGHLASIRSTLAEAAEAAE
jgi:uncharacterized damage-inducible protein DinB